MKRKQVASRAQHRIHGYKSSLRGVILIAGAINSFGRKAESKQWSVGPALSDSDLSDVPCRTPS